MLKAEAARQRAAELGVPQRQIERDHLVSHLLFALGDEHGVVFFGGTALNRTHLPGRRLSEDIDLYRLDQSATPETMVAELLSDTKKEYPNLISRPSHRADVTTFLLIKEELAVKVQIVGIRYEYQRVPTAITPVDLFYDDLPPSVQLLVPTRAALTGMKLVAFAERKVPRDLFDLRGLAEVGAIDLEAVDVCRNLRSSAPQRHEYQTGPSNDEWHAELDHQVKDSGDPEESLIVVRDRLGEILGW